jgi:endonuclease/exonuclease/phosphatase (EEP) superfamily protein YafD
MLLALLLAARIVVAASAPLVVLTAGLPWLGLMIWAASLLLLLVGHRHRVAALPALFIGALWGLVWGRAWFARPESGEGQAITVLSWNVQRLQFEDEDDSPALRCVSEAVLAEDPDAVVFLEVSRRDVDRLAARLGLTCEHTDYHGTGDTGFGGLAACGRGDRWTLRERSARRYVPEIDWYYVFAELVQGDQVFNLIAVHLQPYHLSMEATLSVDDRGRRITGAQHRETASLLGRVEALKDPTIVTGDFNSVRDAALHQQLRGHLQDTWEQAAWGPGWTAHAMSAIPLRIDYTYVTPTVAVAAARIPEVNCSDHRPVVSRLILRGARPSDGPSTPPK